MADAPPKDLVFVYLLKDPEGKEHSFEIRIDPKTMTLKLPSTFTPPAWAKDKKFKCSVCPKIKPGHDHCHSCYNISNIVEEFKNFKSYEDIQIIVKAEDRRYVYKGDVQQGLMAILGLYIATSGCPVYSFLKPMARFHLPFASLDETVFRVTSVYLLKEYFKMKKGETPDWDFKNLVPIYEKISQANEDIINELRSHYKNDAHSNAILILDNFSKALSFLLTDHLDILKPLFELD